MPSKRSIRRKTMKRSIRRKTMKRRTQKSPINPVLEIPVNKNTIDKKTYSEWESQIIQHFYTDKKTKTDLIPTSNNPSILKQSKVIVVIDYDNFSTKVSLEQYDKLPTKHKIMLFHIGKMKPDKVSFGYEDKLFSYPALDFGGLTNYKQTIGEKGTFIGKTITIKKSTDITNYIDSIYNEWKRCSQTNKFYGGIKSKLTKFLRSVCNDEYKQFKVRFVKLPPRHRVVVSVDDIIQLTGVYYERTFDSDDKYAVQTSGKNVFCSVEKMFITPNINKTNLLNEYKTY